MTFRKLKRKWLFLLLLLLPVAGGMAYLYQEKYLACLPVSPIECLRSKKYESAIGKFTFRYPRGYPISFHADGGFPYSFDAQGILEFVNFSEKFYPNAGGKRLGSVVLELKDIKYKDIFDIAEKEMATYEALPKKGKPPQFEFLKIAGQDAVHVLGSPQPYIISPLLDGSFFIHDNILYTIEFNYREDYHKLPIEYYNMGREMVLSTFTLK